MSNPRAFHITMTPRQNDLLSSLHQQAKCPLLKVEVTRFSRVTDDNSNWRSELHN